MRAGVGSRRAASRRASIVSRTTPADGSTITRAFCSIGFIAASAGRRGKGSSPATDSGAERPTVMSGSGFVRLPGDPAGRSGRAR